MHLSRILPFQTQDKPALGTARMKRGGFLRIYSRDSPRFALRIAGPSKALIFYSWLFLQDSLLDNVQDFHFCYRSPGPQKVSEGVSALSFLSLGFFFRIPCFFAREDFSRSDKRAPFECALCSSRHLCIA